MKYVFTFVLLATSFFALGQDDKIVTINTQHPEDNNQLTRNAYHFKEFMDGKVVFKDSVVVEAKMNYHRLLGQVLFINPKGDTLALSNPQTFLHVVIENDTFHYHDGCFLRRATHYKGQNLSVKQTVSFVGVEKAGPYGTYTPLSAANSNTTVTTDDQITNYIQVNENHLYKFANQFYLTDAYNNFFKANKKNFYNLFSKHEKAIKAYLDSNKTDFNKQTDLEKLLAYIHSL